MRSGFKSGTAVRSAPRGSCGMPACSPGAAALSKHLPAQPCGPQLLREELSPRGLLLLLAPGSQAPGRAPSGTRILPLCPQAPWTQNPWPGSSLGHHPQDSALGIRSLAATRIKSGFLRLSLPSLVPWRPWLPPTLHTHPHWCREGAGRADLPLALCSSLHTSSLPRSRHLRAGHH